GTGYSPYRLSIVSARTGERGRVILDPGDTTLRFTTVQKGQDAVVRYGSADAGSSPVLLTSSSNNFDHAVAGLSLSVVSTSSSPVEVSVSRDYDYIATKLGTFVSAFNTLRNKMSAYTAYNSETGQRGMLLGDATVQRLERSLSNLIINRVSGVSGSITRLGQVGISHKTTGGLQYDKEEFYDELRNNLDDVLAFFTTEETGFADRLKDLVEEYTDPYESIFTTKSEALDRRIDLFNERVEHIADLLALKEQRLIKQFTQMESVLGRLQSQMNAISNIRVIGLNSGSDSRKSGSVFGS
ncbi:MAG TPA: flagellar filament capping protein FliD, partial [Planctomycetota bacterium]|nr:flagellar filament capping protein FliD [Planctomycetota bacterium]